MRRVGLQSPAASFACFRSFSCTATRLVNAAAFTAARVREERGPYDQRIKNGLVKRPNAFALFSTLYARTDDIKNAYPPMRGRITMRQFRKLDAEQMEDLKAQCREGRKKYVQRHNSHTKWTPYTLFVMEQMKKPDIQRLQFNERMKAVGKIWKALPNRKVRDYEMLAEKLRKHKK